ncbi:IS200/IS605 family transposase [Nocardiopsis gilva]
MRRGRSVVYNLHAHLVFTPKYRRGVFDEAMLTVCENAMRKVCEDFGAELAEFNGERDHVHLLVHYPPKVALSTLVNSLKGVSSRRLRSEFTGRVNRVSMSGRFWSPSYFVASCGGAPLSIVRDYIENQKRGRHASASTSSAATMSFP